ncbi:uncharacterized protein LOC111165052 [Delphinapterus leucas]|uniref:Uncharacterized protein LOC111165052 n=1 Tax=Delphinapterus leucas TaxID=9749 RepID=A0A7F8KF48_DELLE|nr:uncharacterized protein LOC111165052 [Delphinapterus leucas]
MPARLAADALRPTALPLPAPYLAERRSGRRSGSAAAAACRPACGTAGPAAASLAPSLLLPAPSAVLSAPHALAPPQLSPRAASASSASTCACSAWHPIWARCRTTWHIRPAARATPEAAGQRAAAGLALPAATRRFPVLPHARREDALASKGLLSAQVPAHRPRRSGTRKGAGHGVERAKVPKRSWASRTGAASWAFLHCTYLHSPSEDGLLRRTQLTLLLDWAELSEVESRQSDEAVAFSVRLGDLNCALRNAAEILPSPPLRGLLRRDAEGLGAGGRAPPLPGRPSQGRPPG